MPGDGVVVGSNAGSKPDSGEFELVVSGKDFVELGGSSQGRSSEDDGFHMPGVDRRGGLGEWDTYE